jgi:hypothetical protein
MNLFEEPVPTFSDHALKSACAADGPPPNGPTMQDEKQKPEGRSGIPAKASAPDPKKNSRQDRLKLALRENLKRRKSQTRARSATAAAPSSDEEGE